jgi:translation initiation factor 2-alpha kinase 4
VLSSPNLVKKIKLRDSKKSGDGRLLREVSALRQLNHRYIVRYYTTWTETSDPRSTTASDSDSDAETVDGITSVPQSRSRSRAEDSENLLSLDLNDFGSNSSRSSFPSIHFGGADDSSDGSSEEGEENEDGLKNLIDSLPSLKSLPSDQWSRPKTPIPSTSRTTLYIQMVCQTSFVYYISPIIVNDIGVCREADAERSEFPRIGIPLS